MEKKGVENDLKEIPIEPSSSERIIIKRIKKGEKIIPQKKEKRPSQYVQLANKIFSKLSNDLLNESFFGMVKKDMAKANVLFLPASYISVILLSTIVSFICAIFIFIFFLFFNFVATPPFIVAVTDTLFKRILKTFWILIAVPMGTFFFMYFYPSLERRASESRINQELPFATIHMAAIAGSMVDQSKIFQILIQTKDYPYTEKEFVKLMNQINIYGYDLVNALRITASNSPSRKLADLLNGLATTITSGGDLSKFLEKRSESLLFEYKIEREKYSRTAETFMDIYISVVIAAPMILMLLLMMIKISGLGISISTTLITLIMILVVSGVNILFLMLLHIKQPTQ